MKKAVVLLLSVLLLGLVACAAADDSLPEPRVVYAPEHSSSAASQSAAAPIPLSAYPDNDGTLPVMTARFACESAPLVLTPADTAGEKENGCYSPLSLYILLAMAAPGATGETQAELLRALGAEEAGAGALTDEVSGLLADLPFVATADSNHEDGSSEEVETGRLDIANSLWLNDRFTFKEPYAAIARESFAAELFTVPVPSEETNAAINGWALEKTNGLVDPGIEMEDNEEKTDALCLLNALYYKNKWAGAFSEGANTMEPFTLAGGGEVEAEYMNQTYKGSAQLGAGYVAVQKPMWNGATMTLVLPDEGISPAELLADPALVYAMLDPASYDEDWNPDIILKLPSFTTVSEHDLIEAMQALGVERLFDEDKAELDGMFDYDPNELGPPYVSQLTQDTRIIVDEEGVEAAIVSQIPAVVPPAAPLEGVEIEEIEVFLTHPFLYFITLDDHPTAPLFAGVVYDPTVE